MDGIQLSSDIILPSALSLLVSKNTPISAIQLLQHRVFAVSEMDMLKGSALVYSQTLAYLGYFPNSSVDGVICDKKCLIHTAMILIYHGDSYHLNHIKNYSTFVSLLFSLHFYHYYMKYYITLLKIY